MRVTRDFTFNNNMSKVLKGLIHLKSLFFMTCVLTSFLLALPMSNPQETLYSIYLFIIIINHLISMSMQEENVNGEKLKR